MKTYKWGILGPGSIATKFASDLKLLPNAELHAVGSRSTERAERFAKEYGFSKAYGSYEELVADPELEVVYIASPHIGHYEHALLCLNNGKAVLCEKPIALNAEQYKMMLVTAKKSKKFFMEALWTRFIPSFLKFKDLVESGAIGEVQLIESDFSFRPAFDREGRLFNINLGGGALLDVGIYPVFMALEMAGLPLDTKAQAIIGKTGVDEKCSMLFKHKGNVLSVLFSSIVNRGRTETLIHGTEGYIRLNTMWHIPTTIDLFPNEGEAQHFDFEEPGFGYQYEAKHVMECMDRGEIESNIFSWEKSLDLINTLDSVRKLTGIKYPESLESL